jgi:nitric oxide reductase NorE protein
MIESVDKGRVDDDWGVLGALPGDLMMWVLIVSELLVFGAALLAFLAVRAMHPETFAAGQAELNRTAVAPCAVVGGTVLVLAGVKARLILTQYLGLRASRFWRGSFTLALSIFLLAAFALYLAGTGDGK